MYWQKLTNIVVLFLFVAICGHGVFHTDDTKRGEDCAYCQLQNQPLTTPSALTISVPQARTTPTVSIPETTFHPQQSSGNHNSRGPPVA